MDHQADIIFQLRTRVAAHTAILGAVVGILREIGITPETFAEAFDEIRKVPNIIGSDRLHREAWLDTVKVVEKHRRRLRITPTEDQTL